MKMIQRKEGFIGRFALAVAVILISNAAFAQTRPLGTDVSSFQGSGVNWTQVKSDGVFFAWAKAAEGTATDGYIGPDVDFVDNELHASASGVPVGAYYFARPSADPGTSGADTEAAYFWGIASNYVVADGMHLVPMLDWEDTSATISAGFTAASMSAWMNEWCNDISNYARAEGLLIRPMVYTGSWFSEPGSTYPGLNTSVTNWPTWVSDYPSCTTVNGTSECGTTTFQASSPANAYPWPLWNIWQYGDTNWSGGDADVYNGTTNQFMRMFLVIRTNAPQIVTDLANKTAVEGSSPSLSVTATGGAPLVYYWDLNGSNVAIVTNSGQYLLADVNLTNAGAYTVQVSNAHGSVTSAVAYLSVSAPLSNGSNAVLAPSGLVNWWPFNGNLIDIVSGFNGLGTNKLYYTPGVVGEALHFDGAYSYVTNTNNPATLTGSWSTCMWVYRQTTSQTSDALLSDGTTTLKLEQNSDTHQVGMTVSGVADWKFTNSSGAGYTVPANAWTHLAVVGTGSGASGTETLYINGTEEGILNTNTGLGRKLIGADFFSGAGYLDHLSGALNNLMIFNTALSGAQIQSIYNSGASGVVEAPQFTALSTDGNGNLIFGVEGLTGARPFTVYYSTNLPNWSVLTSTLSAASGSNSFTVSPTNGAAFYRAIQP